MRAITLHQPWASLIALGAKTWETRSWPTKHRGPLAIHAAKAIPKDAQELFFCQPFFDVLRACGMETPNDYPRGVIVALVDLVDCVPTTYTLRQSVSEYNRAFGNWGPERYAWKLENIERLSPPVPARGYQGLWEWDISAHLQGFLTGEILLVEQPSWVGV